MKIKKSLGIACFIFFSLSATAFAQAPPLNVEKPDAVIQLLSAILEELKLQRQVMQQATRLNLQSVLINTQLRHQQARVESLAQELESIKTVISQLPTDFSRQEAEVETAQQNIAKARNEYELAEAKKNYELLKNSLETHKAILKQDSERYLARRQQLEGQLLPLEKAKLDELQEQLSALEQTILKQTAMTVPKR